MSSWTQFAQKYLQLGNEQGVVCQCLLGQWQHRGNKISTGCSNSVCAKQHQLPMSTSTSKYFPRDCLTVCISGVSHLGWVTYQIVSSCFLFSVLLVVLVVVMMVAVWVGIVGRFWWVVGTVGQGPFVNWARKLPWVERFCPCGCLFSGTQCRLKRELWALS